MRFSDLISSEHAPSVSAKANRQAVETDTYANEIPNDIRNAGFVRSLFSRRRSSTARATRRTFLKGSFMAAGAGAVASVSRIGPASEVSAQSAMTGELPRRLWLSCPPYSVNDNCQPGCGPLPVCTGECCDSTGWFREDPANGYRLNTGVCDFNGAPADGWLWAYGAECGACDSIEYRCTDGYILSGDLWFPYICRVTTQCGGVVEAPTTNPFVAEGVIDQAVDVGGGATISGWVKGPTALPISFYVTVDGILMHEGLADLTRPDVFNTVPGAGTNHGFQVTINNISPGLREICVFGTDGVSSTRIGCIQLSITGAGGPIVTPTPTAPPPVAVGDLHDPFGAIQVLSAAAAGGGFASGYAIDLDSTEPVLVSVSVDGIEIAVVPADLPRPDIQAAFPGSGPNTGFAVSFPFSSNGEHTVCIELRDPQSNDVTTLGCSSLVGTSSTPPPTTQPPASLPPGGDYEAPGWGHLLTTSGHVTTLRTDPDGTVRVEGWMYDTSEIDTALSFVVTLDGVDVARGTADLPSPAIAQAHGAGQNHGFIATLAAGPGAHEINVFRISEGGARRHSIGAHTLVVATSDHAETEFTVARNPG